MRISDWSSDVCSSDLFDDPVQLRQRAVATQRRQQLATRAADGGEVADLDLRIRRQRQLHAGADGGIEYRTDAAGETVHALRCGRQPGAIDRKSTRLNSSH